jgi:hypothetical protein
MKHTETWERAEFVFGAQFFNIYLHWFFPPDLTLVIPW